MTEIRQLPLFNTQPVTDADLNPRTHLRDTYALFQAHLLKQGKTAHTVDAFTSDLHVLGEFAGERRPLNKFTTHELNDFLEWLEKGRGVPCSRKTYARRVTTLKVFFKWLTEIGALAQDPAIALLQRSGPAPLAVILDDEEVGAAELFANGLRHGDKPDPRPAFLLKLLVMTGIKKGEAARIAPDDIDREAGNLLIRPASTKHQYKERRLPLERSLFPLFDAYVAHYEPKTTIFTCTPRNLEYILEAVGEGAGLDKKISFEMLRWTFAVRAYLNETEPDVIREALGLSRISWVETFAKIQRLAEKDAETQTRP